jgi:hypothetical protein
LTAPLSSSATRRFTSITQAASSSSSTSAPRLSSKDAASAARSSLGCASASLRMSAGFRHTVRLCEVQSWRDTIAGRRKTGSHAGDLPPLEAFTSTKSEEKAGGTQTREHRSPNSNVVRQGATRPLAYWRQARGAIRNSLVVLHFARRHRAALCAARVLARAGVGVAVSDRRGVRRPPLPSPLLRPMVQLEGVAHAPTCISGRPDGSRLPLSLSLLRRMTPPRPSRRSGRRRFR